MRRRVGVAKLWKKLPRAMMFFIAESNLFAMLAAADRFRGNLEYQSTAKNQSVPCIFIKTI